MLFRLDMKPRQSAAYSGSNTYLQSSRMCGSCHTINLPVADATGEDGKISVHSIEQSTYLEWLNSQYQTEFPESFNLNQLKSCQSCHMPGEYHSEKKRISVDQIEEKIAIIEDETYPEADNRLPSSKIITFLAGRNRKNPPIANFMTLPSKVARGQGGSLTRLRHQAR